MRDKKVRFHYSLCARRQSRTAGRFHASFKMIKHYDRFIGGHDSAVNHRRKRATAREAMRDPLTTRCHSPVLGRSPSVEVSFFFSPSLLAGRDDFREIHDIRSRELMRARGSHAFRSSPVIAGWIEATRRFLT